MKWADRIAALVLMALSLLWIQMSLNLPFPAFARVARMGPGHYPMAVAGLQFILALLLLGQTFRSAAGADAKTDSSRKKSRNPQAVRHVLIGSGLFLAYVITVPFLGFGLATAAFIFSFIRIIGRFGYLLCGALAAGIPLLLWTIFAYLLTVPLPKGPWGF
jgi:putative tricarboxylic transport membrane protein